MNNNVNNTITQMNQASANMMTAFHMATQHQYQMNHQSQGHYNHYTTNIPGTQDFSPAPPSLQLDHKKTPESWEERA
eukprot:4490416-Ditylum_brightwellii.AAC.1